MSNPVVNPMIQRIINRDCHVSASNRAVIRHVVSRLAKKYRTFAALPKQDRKAFMRQCIAAHDANREFYRAVMRGNFGDLA
jgi:uncharacterized protein YlxP (DUF503 family)